MSMPIGTTHQPNSTPRSAGGRPSAPAPMHVRTRTYPTQRRLWWVAMLCALLLAAPIFLLTGLLNPDWVGYARLFESDGAWLAEQGRDPLFLMLMRGASAVFGADGYEEFRVALGWAFIAIAGWLGLGAGWPSVGAVRAGGLGLALAVVNFGWTRFTVQVREGLAMVLVILGIYWACRARSRLLTTLALAGAALIHAGTVLLLLGWLLALLTKCRPDLRTTKLAILLSSLALGFIAGLIAFTLFDAGAVAAGAFDRDEEALAEGGWKFLYWSLLAVCCGVAARAATRAYPPHLGPISKTINYWGWVLMPAVFGLLMAEFATNQALVIVATTSRALAMFNALLLLLAALRSRLDRVAIGVLIFLIIDQSRVIFQALSVAWNVLSD